MARVILPLMGVEATGKLGNALVYMPIPHATDGLTSVRRWLKPKQPNSALQGDVRIKVKAVGYGMKFISVGGELQDEIYDATPAPQIWNAYFLKTCFGLAMADIDDSLSVWLGAYNTNTWISVAASCAILARSLDYAPISVITGGEIMFIHARAAFDLSLSICPEDAQTLDAPQIVSFALAYTSLW